MISQNEWLTYSYVRILTINIVPVLLGLGRLTLYRKGPLLDCFEKFWLLESSVGAIVKSDIPVTNLDALLSSYRESSCLSRKSTPVDIPNEDLAWFRHSTLLTSNKEDTVIQSTRNSGEVSYAVNNNRSTNTRWRELNRHRRTRRNVNAWQHNVFSDTIASMPLLADWARQWWCGRSYALVSLLLFFGMVRMLSLFTPGINTLFVGSVSFHSGQRYKRRDKRRITVLTESSQLVNGKNHGGISDSFSIIAENLPLQHRHERLLYAFYLSAGLAVTHGLQDKLLGQSALAIIWLTFSLAISFMEAWVKFKAPLLRKYVAVDVGRHVFAAQHAVELGLACAFWLQRTVTANTSIYYPAMASTGILFILAFLMGPLLYFRAKNKMVNEAVLVTAEEKVKLDKLSQEIRGKHLPDARWHVLYVLLDAIKVAGLGIFAKNCLLLRSHWGRGETSSQLNFPLVSIYLDLTHRFKCHFLGPNRHFVFSTRAMGW